MSEDARKNEENLTILKRQINSIEEQNNRIIRYSQQIIHDNNILMKQFNISADINHYEDHSWAVISIQGKPEYVKFVDLSNQDMRSVHSFLKQFERTNRTIDSPIWFLRE